jgi:hypothetical protein
MTDAAKNHEFVAIQNDKFCDESYELKKHTGSLDILGAATMLSERLCQGANGSLYKARLAKGVDGIQEEVDDLAHSSQATADFEAVKKIQALLQYIRFGPGTTGPSGCPGPEVHEKRESPKVGDREKKKGENKGEGGGEGGSKQLSDFMKDRRAVAAGLSEAELVALRLYTAIAHTYINAPLRDEARVAAQRPCPMPVTTRLAMDGILKLQDSAWDSASAGSTGVQPEPALGSFLWRGMGRTLAGPGLLKGGRGLELAFLSATSDLDALVRNCVSRVTVGGGPQGGASEGGESSGTECSETDSSVSSKTNGPENVVFKIITGPGKGADLEWLSVFPGEKETVFPPFTYLKRTEKKLTKQVAAVAFPHEPQSLSLLADGLASSYSLLRPRCTPCRVCIHTRIVERTVAIYINIYTLTHSICLYIFSDWLAMCVSLSLSLPLCRSLSPCLPPALPPPPPASSRRRSCAAIRPCSSP